MKLALHIFRKDARRLWPAAAISIVLLALLMQADRWRFDSIVNNTEGWLNLVLPLAWACLLALTVLEEPLSGERHFWLTRPHRWPALLSAKLLFALAFVHLPKLIADSYVVAAHGFSPAECAAQLLGQQAMLAASVTLPAIAIAALVGSFTHFVMLLFAIALGGIFASGGPFRTMPLMQRPVDYLRPELVIAVLAMGAIAVVAIQYRGRKLGIARGVALLTAVMAGGLYGYAPESFDYRMRAALHPAPALGLRLSGVKAAVTRPYVASNRETIAVPVMLTGVPQGALYHFGPVDLTIHTNDGASYRSASFAYYGQSFGISFRAGVMRFPIDLESAPLSLLQNFEPALYRKLKGERVRITGRMPVSFFRMGETAWMPLPGRTLAPGVGHCSADFVAGPWSSKSLVKVLCESPTNLPRITSVTVSTGGAVPEWQQVLADNANFNDGPHWTWLSPLDRAKAFLHTSDPATRRYSRTMEIPLESVDKARIGITPEIPTGYSLVDFEFRDLLLSDFAVKPYDRR
jgi:hypothetical protein